MQFSASPEIKSIVEKAFAGGKLTHEEIVAMCEVDEFSADGFYLQWAGRKMNSDLSDGYAEVHAQIGLDSNLCKRNCKFCSFAAINNSRDEAHAVELSMEKVESYVRMFVEEGVNVISLMGTANLDFEKYLDYVRLTRKIAGPEMPIMINYDDFSYEQAVQLKEAGGTFVYHALRMGEGFFNEIEPETRIQTMKNAKAAGLGLAVGCEMIDPRYTSDEVASRMELLLDLDPIAVTATGMVSVPGSQLENEEHYNLVRYDLYNCIMRLAAGTGIRFCCNCNGRSTGNNGNVGWAQFGPNPRDLTNETEGEGGEGRTVREERERFESMGWKTFRGPSKYWGQ